MFGTEMGIFRNNYMNLTPDCPKNRFSSRLDLQQYGMGMGAIGLPGDTSPASRGADRPLRVKFYKA